MAQDINLRRLVIKSFHIDTVEWGDHNDVTADGKMTVSRELLDELMEENKDIIEKIDIQIIKPGDHDRWTNTIMDIIPSPPRCWAYWARVSPTLSPAYIS